MIGEAHFDIWFAPERGLLSLLQTPANSFGWVGRGMLLFEPHGLRFRAARNRLLQFLRADHFIALSEVAEVYREGNAIRVQLRSRDPSKPFVSFWASDPASAANIVGLMPTAATVELDEPITFKRKTRRQHPAWMLAAALLAAVVLAAAWKMMQRGSETEIASTPVVAATPAVASRTETAPAPPVEVDLIAQDLERFLIRKEALTQRYMQLLEALQLDRIRAEMFGLQVHNTLIPEWHALEEELRAQSLERGSARAQVRDLLVQVTEDWQRALRDHVRGLQEQNPEVVRRAFELYMRRASDTTTSAIHVRDALRKVIRPSDEQPPQ
ncbi:MAG TPA: hypothetical protein VIL32_11790 [Steroidobacteraceae bacterium]